MAATKASHRAVAAILLLAIAVGTAQAAVSEPGAGGRGQGATTTTTSARVPLPLAVTVRCTKVHVVKAGETCASVARDFRLTVAQFMVLNQEYTCTAAPLPHGRWVCVRGSAVG